MRSRLEFTADNTPPTLRALCEAYWESWADDRGVLIFARNVSEVADDKRHAELFKDAGKRTTAQRRAYVSKVVPQTAVFVAEELLCSGCGQQVATLRARTRLQCVGRPQCEACEKQAVEARALRHAESERDCADMDRKSKFARTAEEELLGAELLEQLRSHTYLTVRTPSHEVRLHDQRIAAALGAGYVIWGPPAVSRESDGSTWLYQALCHKLVARDKRDSFGGLRTANPRRSSPREPTYI
jgi:hypothetical protein